MARCSNRRMSYVDDWDDDGASDFLDRLLVRDAGPAVRERWHGEVELEVGGEGGGGGGDVDGGEGVGRGGG